MANARKKVLADLHLEGDYYLAGEGENGGDRGSGGHGGAGDGEEGDDGGGGGGVGENGYSNGAVRGRIT